LVNDQVIYVAVSTGQLLPNRPGRDRIATRIRNRAQPCGVRGVPWFKNEPALFSSIFLTDTQYYVGDSVIDSISWMEVIAPAVEGRLIKV